jgi:cytochrome c556
MKKSIGSAALGFFAVAVLVFAVDNAKSDLRPSQKVMQARQAWMKGMKENLGAKKFAAIVMDADLLADQTSKAGEALPNPQAKEITLAIAALSKDLAAAATKQDGEAVKAKLAAIKAKCDECHAKIRDKK